MSAGFVLMVLSMSLVLLPAHAQEGDGHCATCPSHGACEAQAVDSMSVILTEEGAQIQGLALLAGHGVADPVVCETQRVEAPLTGYLLDATGSLVVEGIEYTTFRIGVRDGQEEQDGMFRAGDEFVFIARGVDGSGDIHWLPAPGPDTRPEDGAGFDVTWEFLWDREAFEAIELRFFPEE